MIEVIGDQRADRRITRERAPVEQQVVEIEDAEGALACPVGAEDLGEGLVVLITPGKELGEDLAQRCLGVDGAGIDVEHRRGTRKTPRTLGPSTLRSEERRV